MKYKIDDTEYNVIIVKKNNKNIYTRIDDNLNIVITTRKCSIDFIISLLDKNKEQLKKMIKLKEKQNEKNINFYYLGKKYDIITIGSFNKVEMIDDKIFIPNNKELDKWLIKNMKNIYQERLDYWYNIEENIP